MRALHYIDSLARGGTENLLLDLFRIHARCGHEFHLATARSGEMEGDFKDLGISFSHLGGRRPGLDLRLIRELRARIKAGGFDVIHTHTVLDAMDVWLATMGMDIPQVMSVHGFDFDDTIKLKVFSKFLFPRLDRVVFVSDAVREHYRRKYRHDNQSVVHNGVNLDKFSGSRDESVRIELNVPDGVHLCGMVGNFVNAVRNQEFVCRALIRLSKIRRDFRFVFVGRRSNELPHLFDNCKAMIEAAGIGDLVMFLGGRKDVPRLMSALDSYAYASNSDTFGISVAEAMIAGVPCIVNDLPALCEVVRGDEYGNVYRTGDEQGFIDLMGRVLDGDPVIAEKARAAGDFARSAYSIDACMGSYAKVYAELLARDVNLD